MEKQICRTCKDVKRKEEKWFCLYHNKEISLTDSCISYTIALWYKNVLLIEKWKTELCKKNKKKRG